MTPCKSNDNDIPTVKSNHICHATLSEILNNNQHFYSGKMISPNFFDGGCKGPGKWIGECQCKASSLLINAHAGFYTMD